MSGTLTLAMTVTNSQLSGQNINKWHSSSSATSSQARSGSDVYFPPNDTFKKNGSTTPRRDPNSLTAPSIPSVMDSEPGSTKPANDVSTRASATSPSAGPIYRTAQLPPAPQSGVPQEPVAKAPNNSTSPQDTNTFVPSIAKPHTAPEPTVQSTAPAFNAPFQRPPEQRYYDPKRLAIISGTPAPVKSARDPTTPVDEPELALPSNLQMAGPWIGKQAEVQNREMFWEQFPTTPTGNKNGRTEGYESLPAILNNGFWFGGVDVMFLEPIFQSNNVLTTSGNGTSSSTPADYNFDAAWKGYFGFETNAGPAVKASFFRYNEFSGPVSFVSDGTISGESIVQSGDPVNVFRLNASNAGDRIETQQQIKLNSIDLLFYKDQKNPVSRVRGNVGLRYISLQQFLFADLFEAAGPVTSLRSVNDFQGMGPKLGIEYFRPVGHTDLELQSGLFGSLMFGRRDHTVTDVGNLQYRQLGKIEPISIFEMYLGLQWNFKIARCQTGFFRTAIESQYWSGGESPAETGTDFGFYGLTAGFGVKR